MTTTNYRERWDALRTARIEHDNINGKPIGTLTVAETARMVELRQLLAGTEFAPWSETQTHEAYESIYGIGSW